jgi:hypothetical protein
LLFVVGSQIEKCCMGNPTKNGLAYRRKIYIFYQEIISKTNHKAALGYIRYAIHQVTAMAKKRLL